MNFDASSKFSLPYGACLKDVIVSTLWNMLQKNGKLHVLYRHLFRVFEANVNEFEEVGNAIERTKLFLTSRE